MELTVIKHVEVGTITIGEGERHWMDEFALMAAKDMRDSMTEETRTFAVYEAGELELTLVHNPAPPAHVASRAHRKPLTKVQS